MSLFRKLQPSKYQKFIDKFPTLPPIEIPHLSTLLQQRLDVPDSVNGSIVPPISLGSKYSQSPPGTPKNGHFYDRYSNPTTATLNDVMARLDNVSFAHSTASGMAAFAAIMSLFGKGDEVILADDTYTGTKKCLKQIFKPLGMSYQETNFSDLHKIKNCINKNTKAILLETPTNPTMKVYDIHEISKICKQHNVMLIVDNTTAMQVSTSAFELGADIVWYSCSKFIGGHSDAMAGCVLTNDKELSDRLYQIVGTSGQILSPFTAYLVLRGLYTFKIRMQHQIRNSLIVSNFLNQHQNIEAVYHTGLEDNPYREIIKKQMRVPAAVFSFRVKANEKQVEKFVESFKNIKFTESFGATKTIMNYSCKQTHRFATEQEKKLEGITDNFFRISIGLEEPEDVLSELDFALNNMHK